MSETQAEGHIIETINVEEQLALYDRLDQPLPRTATIVEETISEQDLTLNPLDITGRAAEFLTEEERRLGLMIRRMYYADREKREAMMSPSTRRSLLEPLVNLFGRKIVGVGGSNIVIDSSNPKQVIEFQPGRGSLPKELLRDEWLQEIFRRLFPHNFPKITAMWDEPYGFNLTGTVRERIDGVAGGFETSVHALDTDPDCRFPFSKVLKELKAIGFENPEGLFDTHMRKFSQPGSAKDFKLTADGRVYYLDKPQPFEKEMFENILKFVHDNNYDPQTRYEVEKYVKLFTAFYKEEV